MVGLTDGSNIFYSTDVNLAMVQGDKSTLRLPSACIVPENLSYKRNCNVVQAIDWIQAENYKSLESARVDDVVTLTVNVANSTVTANVKIIEGPNSVTPVSYGMTINGTEVGTDFTTSVVEGTNVPLPNGTVADGVAVGIIWDGQELPANTSGT